MSNNNHPHSHLSQAAAAAAQNPSWNPLQIPSYIPRQPQLAHMSNERPMVRSPLAWQQPPPPPDAIYNFMSANHKNLDHHHQMNSLLAPPYTGTLPFDSMDLSLQSTRSAASPLTKSGLPPQQQQQQQQQQQTHGNAQQHQQQQQQQSLMHAPPNFPSIHNLSTSNATPQQGHLAVLAAAHAASLLTSNNLNVAAIPTSTPSGTSTVSKYLNANGSDCESLLPPPPTTTSGSATATSSGNSSNHTTSSSGSSSSSVSNNNLSNQSPTPHYMHQNRDDSFKLSQLKQRNFEKEKDCRIMQQHQQQQQHSNKKPSPLRNYHQQQQQQQQQQQHQQAAPYNMTPKYNGPQTPPTPQSPLAGPLPPPHQMDYNQLHLHHQLGGGYQHMQQSVPAGQEQHLHYHNQHVPPSHHPPHISSAQFHAQQSPQANLPGQQQQPQSQQTQAPTQQPPMHHHSRNSQQLTNLDLLPKPKQSDMEIERERDEQTVITDLSYRHNATTPTTTPALPPPSSSSGESEKPAAASTNQTQLTEAPESPYLTTSNEESLESNSNSNSNSRKRRKRKSSLVMRLTPNENALEMTSTNTNKHIHGNSSSPKQTPKNGTAAAGADFHPFQSEMPIENGRASSPAQTENSNSNSTLYNDDNPKTKKQRQALLQRNLTEQQQQRHHPVPEDEPVANPTPPATATMPPPPSPQSNSSSSSSSSSSGNTHSSHSSQDEKQETVAISDNKIITDTPASPALMEQGSIDAKPAVSVHEQDEDENEEEGEVEEIKTTENDSSKTPEISPPPLTKPPVPAPPDTAIAPPTTTTEPCHFGEVEDKLEEMFAGIEEEAEGDLEKPAEEKTKTNEVVGHDLSSQLAMDNAKAKESSTPPTPELRPVATKAAMKSTLPSPVHSPMLDVRSTSTPLPESQIAEESEESSKSQPLKSTPQRRPPPRRLSIGMDATLLRFSLDDTSSRAKTKKTVGRKKLPQPEPEDSDDDNKPSTSAAAAAALAARKLNETANIKNNNSKTSATQKKSPQAKGKSKKSVGKPANKNSKQNGKNTKSGGRKPITTDEDSTPAPAINGGTSSTVDLKFKSPYILIKPDGTVSIKNTHSAEDINEKQTKAKKAPHERKNIRGMHSSTLSNRYDADTTDSSWICVFCKRGPHKLGLGDLFGPYLVSIDCDEYRAALQSPGAQDIDSLFVSKRKRVDMVKLQERNLPVVQASLANIMQAPKISMHKRKRKQAAQDSSYSDDQFDLQSRCSSSMADPLDCSQETKLVETFRGMCKTSEHGYEIWLHEDCAIWTNDIQLIGAHVNGLDAAVWDSTRYQCIHCSQTGANVCCFQRACKATSHVPCARSASWHLNEQDRKVFCQLHGPPREAGKAMAETIANNSVLTIESLMLPSQPPDVLNVNSLP